MMTHIIQVGLGSGGMAVLDMILKDPRIGGCTLIEPDVFKHHNLQRHLFGSEAVGKLKVEYAAKWIKERRPDVRVECIPKSLQECQGNEFVAGNSGGPIVGICAVDNEIAKYFWCSLMRKQQIPWTLGEVLSGGIAGFVHAFSPNGPCYGCVASFLKREGPQDSPIGGRVDYSHPESMVEEMRVSASFTSIMTVASMHTAKTLEILDGEVLSQSLLMPMKKVDGVFSRPWQGMILDIPRNPECFFCKPQTAENLDYDEIVERKIQELSGGI